MSNRQATIITASTKTSGPGLYLVKTAGVTVTLETWTHWPDISQTIVIKDQTGQTNPNITIVPPGVIGANIDGAPNLSINVKNTSATLAPLAGGISYTLADYNQISVAQIGANLGWASVTDPAYGADPTGVADSSAAFQSAVNSGFNVIYVPPGTYSVANVLLPTTANLVIFGTGEASRIIQRAGAPVFKWAQASMSFNEQTIRDLYFDAGAGTDNTIDTTGQGTVTMSNLFFSNTPTGKANIYVNGTAGTYTHDVRLSNIRCYNIGGGNAGYAKVRFGPLGADSSIDQMYANGNFTDLHSIAIDPGATDIQVNNSHVYNTAQSVIYNQGTYCAFTGDTFDFAASDAIMRNLNAGHTTITGCYFQGIAAGTSGIVNVSTTVTNIVNCKFFAASGAVSAVKDDAASVSTVIDVADIASSVAYTKIFDLQGTNSYARAVPGYAPLGLSSFYSGVTAAPVAQATTTYLGQLGAAANYLNTAFTVGMPQTVTGASIGVDTTPAAGQTMTFTLYDGAASLGSCTINNGGFGCTITANAAAAVNDSLYIKSVFSATSGSANVRYAITYRG